jgi:hypothetical protein
MQSVQQAHGFKSGQVAAHKWVLWAKGISVSGREGRTMPDWRMMVFSGITSQWRDERSRWGCNWRRRSEV